MNTLAPGKTRRTEGVLTGGRSARVVDTVLHATAEELSRVGYAALRIDDVATRSGVNKTTIYRRWPGKPELVAAALSAVAFSAELPDTGELRADLLGALHEVVAFAKSRAGRGLVQIMMAERSDPEVDALAKRIRTEQRAARTALVQRAIDRRELPAVVDPALVAELVFAPVFTRMLASREQVSDELAAQIVDTVLAGVRARAAEG